MKVSKNMTILAEEKDLTALEIMKAEVESKLKREKDITVFDKNFYGVLIEFAAKKITKDELCKALIKAEA
jgi:hypothetical protein